MTASRHRGLTLIELLAATALAALLMVTLLQVIQTTGRSRAAMDTIQLEGSAWRARLTGVMQADLNHSRRAAWDGQQLLIEGWNGWQRSTREPAHEPAHTVYRFIETPAPSTTGYLLVREQRDLLDLGQQRPTQELLAAGITRWDFTPAPGSLDDPAPENHNTFASLSLPGDHTFSVLTLTFNDSEPLRIVLPAVPEDETWGAP
ncbi:MAG: prepilin-type N-terminal cleavage/methylation domain-containing protein [Planctomycetota bacterium]